MLTRTIPRVARRAAPLLLGVALAGAGLSTAYGQADREAAAQPPRPFDLVADDRKDDRAAIREAVGSFVKAFESRDPKALAAHWTSEGEYRNESGVTIRGREALEKGFTAFFARTPEVKAEVDPEALRFLSRDSAIEEGTVTVRRGLAEPATRGSYTALFVREDDRWRIAQLGESADDTVSIDDLGWLVGEWKSGGGQGADIRTTYSWAPNKKFLHGQFTIREKGLTLTGSQVIGVDPATGEIHSWTFEADGGVGEADWGRDGDHWVLDAAGTLSDGRSLVETNILRRVNDDTFTWQSVERMLGDAELPDLAPVKVTRVQAAR